jgi:hypothetical protein
MPKRKKTLSEKLSEVDSFLNIEIFSADDFDQMVHRYIPQFRDLESIKELTEGNDNALKILHANKYRSHLKKIRGYTHIEGDDRYAKLSESAQESECKDIKHHILAIALSQFNRQRLKETENDLASSRREVRDLKEIIPPSSIEEAEYKDLQKLYKSGLKNKDGTPFISNKKRSQKRWWAWDREFNWYEDHTVKEISGALQVNVKTIRQAGPEPKSRTRVGKAVNTLLYSPDDCLEILKWWLGHYLPRKTKDKEHIKHTGEMILNNLKFGNHNLSEVEMNKVRKVVLDICGPEAAPYSSVFDAR